MAKNNRRRKSRGYTPRRPRKRSPSFSSMSSGLATQSSVDSDVSQSLPASGDESTRRSKSYRRLRKGLQKSVPAAIVMWPFHKLRSDDGLTSRRIINFIKKHYRVIDNPRKTGKSIGTLLRCAVEFGLIEKRGNRYFLAHRTSPEGRRRK